VTNISLEGNKDLKTIVGLFDDMAEAKKAAHDLEAAGVAHNDISFVANNEGAKHVANTAVPTVSGHAIGHDAVVGAEIGGVAGLLLGLTAFAIPGLGWIAGAGWLMGMIYGAGTGAVVGGLVGALTHIGVPAEDAAHYNEGVRRGGTLLAVKAEDNMAAKVAQILGADGAVNIDERAEQYKQQGFLPTPNTPAVPRPAVTTPVVPPAPINPPATIAKAGETVLPVVEEELLVGKREVERGGVRVYTHVTETPVEEKVQLHEEHVNVERHVVNRPVTSADAAFKNENFELRETAEEAVISKQARVVEEVIVGKTATDRTETVHDTVRRTDVEVEKIPGQTFTTGSADHVARNVAAALPGNGVPGIQTGGHDVDGSPDTRGITEKVADAVTGDRIDDKTGKPVA
jgi:uncharacterized protein (TIGR02271 family)